ncbi:MAG: flippase-like domain-containing protein, partial [Acidimicrobiia bacterium]|nr:flippase-like domain-containing protein [Acidimicrobiia bacterium]
EATGAEDLSPLQIRRLSLVNVGMLAGVLVALALLIPALAHIDYASVQHEFATAHWGWAAFALLLYPLIPIAWATAVMGAVQDKLPVVPTVLAQNAASFLNLVTPNGIGGTALQIDYLRRRDIPVVPATTAYVLSTGVGSAMQTIMLVVAASITSTSLNLSANPGTIGLLAVAVVAAAIGTVLLIPRIRSKVVPAVQRAAHDAWVVLRTPSKALQLVGGNLLGDLLYPALLGSCLLAFGQHLGFAQLVVVQIGAGFLGSVAPVPGGIGVQEAALTAGLTGFGVASAPAIVAVLIFRAITFLLPPIAGFFTLRWLRRSGLV